MILGENVEFSPPFFMIWGKNVEFSLPFSDPVENRVRQPCGAYLLTTNMECPPPGPEHPNLRDAYLPPTAVSSNHWRTINVTLTHCYLLA